MTNISGPTITPPLHRSILLAVVARTLGGRLERQIARPVQTVHANLYVLRLHDVRALAHGGDRFVGRRPATATAAAATAYGITVDRHQMWRVWMMLRMICTRTEASSSALVTVIIVEIVRLTGGRRLAVDHRRRRTGERFAEAAASVRADGELDAVGYVNGARVTCALEMGLHMFFTMYNTVNAKKLVPTLWLPGRCHISLASTPPRRTTTTTASSTSRRPAQRPTVFTMLPNCPDTDVRLSCAACPAFI